MIAGNREEKKVTLYVFLWFAGFRWMGWFRSVSGEERKTIAAMEVFLSNVVKIMILTRYRKCKINLNSKNES
jgi:hypothetical protein